MWIAMRERWRFAPFQPYGRWRNTSGGVGDTPTSERSSVLQATRAKESRKYVTVTIHNDDRIAGDIIYSEIPFEIQKKKNKSRRKRIVFQNIFPGSI